jgi:glycine cleavage system P protein (glycine dehydrogenase) subunit 2
MKHPGRNTLGFHEPLVFELKEKSFECRPQRLPEGQEIDPAEHIPPELLRDDELCDIPQLSEPEVVRHYTRYSTWNYGVDTGFYPLGSCTMKYNPKINEALARLPGFAGSHPLLPEKSVSGNLRLMYELQQMLAELTGMSAVTLQPTAGAHGELTGMMVIRAYHQKKNSGKNKVIIPDSAHGTNPASAILAGFKVIPLKTGPDGILRPEDLRQVLDDEVAALMITNPNTVGLFESYMDEIADMMHERDALIYCDGANMNALMGKVKVGEIGVDVVHLNLHKTFSTPHGGGGPGSGPVAVVEKLTPFLPVPLVEKEGERYYLDFDRPDSIGRVKSFYGNFSIMVRAYAYMLALGAEGLTRSTELAVLNANYIRARLESRFHLPYQNRSLHECVFSDKLFRANVSTLDIAKALIDRGFHPPTTYFPLIVPGALMIEPTESESKLAIDDFCDSMIEISRQATENPQLLKESPTKTAIGRLDETRAARKPVLRYTFNE